jgi:hypothetical protein
MHLNKLAPLFGLTTVAIVSTTLAPMQAIAAEFQVESGTTSVFLDVPLLQSIGLNLTGTSDTVPPVSNDFLVGFDITPNTNFKFSDQGGFEYLGGSIEHSGSVTFNNSIGVGNFSIGFDAARVDNTKSGFFVKDTLSTIGTILFDIGSIDTLQFSDKNLKVGGNLLVSPEFAGVLTSALNAPNLTGAVVGKAQTNAIAESVPEPTSMLALLAVGAAVVARKGRPQSEK